MSDFEDRVKRLMQDNVDQVAGPRRAAPPFARPGASGRGRGGGSRRAPWIAPLLAAACVALVAGVTAGTVQLLSDKAPVATQPPSPPPSPVVSSPTTTPTHAPTTTGPTNHGQSQQAGTHSTKGSPPPNVVNLDGARIALPQGWVARDYQRYGGNLVVGPKAWCLTPNARPVQQGDGGEYSAPTGSGCPIVFGRYDSNNGLDADQIGGTSGNPPQCPAGSGLQAQYADRQFGGRTADWRYYHLRCNSTHAVLEHYVVLTYPAIVMYSMLDTPQVHQAMASIAARSTLPPQTRPLRMTDRGYVRSVHKTADGVRITLDRVVILNKIVNNNPETYTYDIPRRLIESTVHVGDYIVDLQTDGSRVTSFTNEG